MILNQRAGKIFAHPIRRQLHFQVLPDKAIRFGRTVNISQAAVLFTTGEDLRSGDQVELNISWPSPACDPFSARLLIGGRIVNSAKGWAVVAVQRYKLLRDDPQAHAGTFWQEGILDHRICETIVNENRWKKTSSQAVLCKHGRSIGVIARPL